MLKNCEDILVFVVTICLAVFGVYIFGYILRTILLVGSFFIVFFCCVIFLGIIGEVINEASKQAYIMKYEYDKALARNGGNIDGAHMKFGDAEVYVEGPRNSFLKGLKYIITGKEEYSTKFKIAGKEVGKINVDSDGGIKFKWQ